MGDSITVTWTDGASQTIEKPGIKQLLRVTRSSDLVTPGFQGQCSTHSESPAVSSSEVTHQATHRAAHRVTANKASKTHRQPMRKVAPQVKQEVQLQYQLLDQRALRRALHLQQRALRLQQAPRKHGCSEWCIWQPCAACFFHS